MPDLDLSALKTEKVQVCPPGVYSAIITLSLKEVNSKPAISFDYIITDTKALANPADKPVDAGFKFNELAFIDKNIIYSLPLIDACLAAAGAPHGDGLRPKTVDKIVEAVQNVDVIFVVTNKKDKVGDTIRAKVKPDSIQPA